MVDMSAQRMVIHDRYAKHYRPQIAAADLAYEADSHPEAVGIRSAERISIQREI